MLKKLALIAAFAALTSPALAEPVKVETKIRGSEMPVPLDDNFDILGIKLGMTIEEARDAFEGELRERRNAVGGTNNMNGFEAHYEYINKLTWSATTDQKHDTLEAFLGSDAVENRVIAINRRFVPKRKKKIRTSLYRDLLIKKYGKPSTMNKPGTFLFWIYTKDGKADMQWPKNFENSKRQTPVAEGGRPDWDSSNLPTCVRPARDWPTLGYTFGPKWFDYDKDCVAVLYVRLRDDGFNGLGEARFRMIDHRRSMADFLAIDEAISSGLEGKGVLEDPPKL